MSTLRVWAPDAETVTAVIDGASVDMHRRADGWWDTGRTIEHGQSYAFCVDGGPATPDPRSLWQPDGVHAASRAFDHGRFAWTDAGWRGVPLAGSIVYELHLGTFTGDGTADAAIERLDHLVDLGVDLVELLPVNAFDGPRGWGYDGVDLYAVHEAYGGPDGLKRLVDACHARGLGVILDVVYNHLGPSGNYLDRFGPYFTDTHTTPWGRAVNLDAPGSDEVRRFLVDNALMWLEDYHFDGLRLDAVHAFADDRAVHLLEELAVAVHALGARVGKPLFVIAESDRNDPRTVTPIAAGGHGMDAQWSDDFHHALHSLLTGERQGYYVDFGSLPTLAKALTQVFVHDGCYSTFRGRRHGRPVDVLALEGHRFLGYLQDHDQVGNRAVGDRISQLVSPGLLAVGAALVLTSPFTPMLFMGEEWGASTPWQFFASFSDPELAAATREGRRREFADFGWDPETVPDPMDPDTFARSRLDWAELDKDEHARLLDWYKRLIALRKAEPDLTDGRVDRVRCSYDEAERWFVMRRGSVATVANLSSSSSVVPVGGSPAEVLAASTEACRLHDSAVELDPESVAIVRLATAE